MQQTFQALEEDPTVSVAILTGNKNSFAVGADIKELEK
jgi:enoyl-CoA hydratase/carnithine racemase